MQFQSLMNGAAMKLGAVSVLVLLLAGCSRQMTPEQQAAQAALIENANQPVTCRAGKDCDEKWSRAVQWVKVHSAYKFQTMSDNLIQTYGPFDSDPRSAFSITKVAQGNDIYIIDFSANCDNWIGCIPPVINLKADFVNFVMGLGAVTSNQNPRFASAYETIAVPAKQCQDRRLNGELKSYVASAKCLNPQIEAALKNAGYVHTDLIKQLLSKRIEVASKIDSGQMTEAEGQQIITEFSKHLDDIESKHQASYNDVQYSQ